jgi:hypothetical protein
VIRLGGADRYATNRLANEYAAGRFAVRIFAGRAGGKTGGCGQTARVVWALGFQGNARGAGRIGVRTAGGFDLNLENEFGTLD